MIEPEIIRSLQSQMEIELPAQLSYDELLDRLSLLINDLIQHRFQHLVQLLYRIDVNETKLRTLLQEHPEADAGRLIAKLILDRQLQKIQTRSNTNKNNPEISEEEKW
jgi:hypothetical protein